MSGGSVYSPLPQSNSDSDEFSEEELHTSSEGQNVIRQIANPQKHTKSEFTVNIKKLKLTNYKKLDDNRDVGVAVNGFQSVANELRVLKRNNKVDTLSATRKICFIFSLFLCVFTIVIFLWVLPCEIDSCSVSSILVNYWKKELFNLEIYGPISVVPNIKGGSQNLIFMFRKSLMSDNKRIKFVTQYEGLISLLGNNGKESWSINFQKEPKDIDCSLIDVNNDGFNDCLVIGSSGYLKAIESLTGSELWDVYNNKMVSLKQCNLSFPIVLPDSDKDHVSYLLTTCSVLDSNKEEKSLSKHNYFVLICGRTGKIIGKLLEIEQCSSVWNIILEKELIVSYTCLDSSQKESVQTISLADIISNMKIVGKVSFNQTKVQHTQHKTINEEKVFYVLGRHLILDNQGHCPSNCSMTVTVKGLNNETLWKFNWNKTFGMNPVVMKFKKISGFAFKYWQWHTPGHKITENNQFNMSNSNSRKYESALLKNSIYKLNEPQSLLINLFSDASPGNKRYKRMLTKFINGTSYKNSNFTFHRIIETIVVITFNETDTHVVNASQFEIIQVCKNGKVCQPDPKYQRHSLFITDMDHDNYQELVSYSSTFISQLEQPKSDKYWPLQSIVQVIRLEAELSKLYDNQNK